MKTKIGISLRSPRNDIKLSTAVCIMLMQAHIITKMGHVPAILDRTGRRDSGLNLIVMDAFKEKCSHLLLVDGDAKFQPDAAEVLLQANKDIIGANARKRTGGAPAITHNLKGENLNIVTKPIDEVDWIGTHVTMIKMSVFEKMGCPWFYGEPISGEAVVITPDVLFCRRARESGFKVYVHNLLSYTVSHAVEEDINLTDFYDDQIEPYKGAIRDAMRDTSNKEG
jgi:hypothetical protein